MALMLKHGTVVMRGSCQTLIIYFILVSLIGNEVGEFRFIASGLPESLTKIRRIHSGMSTEVISLPVF